MTTHRLAGVAFVLGSIAILVGTLDPLEGSIVILIGSAVVLGSVVIAKQPLGEVRYWLWTFLLILVGVTALWGWSAVGGIGGRSGHSMWWGLTMLPYPVGWWLAVSGIVRHGIRSWRTRRHVQA